MIIDRWPSQQNMHQSGHGKRLHIPTDLSQSYTCIFLVLDVEITKKKGEQAP